MYPTNYMNPMNNQPMSPDYGYNRMQQVQQMQQAINPTVPNMFGQMNQMNNMNQQQQTPYISAIPVTCLDEAKAARISLDGTLSVFINIQDGEIYTKQLRSPLKYSDREIYEEVVDKLYKECYGEHFSDWLAEKAVENFKNVDGTEGAHWTIEQIDDVIRQYNIKCVGFNRWDLYYVMNMLYSDYYNVLGSDTAIYVKLSKAWFEDPDVSEGKAYRYYMQVAKA